MPVGEERLGARQRCQGRRGGTRLHRPPKRHCPAQPAAHLLLPLLAVARPATDWHKPLWPLLPHQAAAAEDEELGGWGAGWRCARPAPCMLLSYACSRAGHALELGMPGVALAGAMQHPGGAARHSAGCGEVGNRPHGNFSPWCNEPGIVHSMRTTPLENLGQTEAAPRPRAAGAGVFQPHRGGVLHGPQDGQAGPTGSGL